MNIIDVNSQKIGVKNELLYKSKVTMDEKISAVRHANGRDWWLFIFSRENGEFVRFLLTENGISESQSQNIPNSIINFEESFDQFLGFSEMVFSPQGDRLAFLTKGGGGCVLFDFDRCTGLFANPYFFTRIYSESSGVEGEEGPYSCAFSPDGSKLYLAKGHNPFKNDTLFQYDLTQENVRVTETTIHKYDNGTAASGLGQMELAPDGRIYFVVYCNGCFSPQNVDSNFYYLHAIDYPDKKGAACGLHLKKRYLGGRGASMGLPNMPNWRLKGLPFANAGGDPYRRCGGDSVHIGAPRQSCQYYKWALAPGLNPADTAAANPKVAPDITTTYTLTTWIDGSDEISVDSVTVFVTAFANGYITAAPDTFSSGPFTVHFTAAGADTTGLTFNWDFGDQQTGTGAITSHTYDALDGYHVKLFAQSQDGACKDTFAYYLKLTLITGVSEAKTKENSFKLYPNPANETVTLEHDYENATVEIFTPLGKVVHSQNAPKPKTTVDLRRFAKGIYYIRLITNLNQILVVKKLIVN